MSIKGSCLCPACGKDLAPKRIHEHTSECSAWLERYAVPIPYFKYSAKSEFFSEGAVEGQDYIRCRVCAQYGWDFRFARLMDHLTGVHKLDEAQYLALFPGASVRLIRTAELRRQTARAKYGVDNTSQAEKIKAKIRETCLERYGTENIALSKEIQAKRAKTNLAKYGVENPFQSPEVQEAIRRGHIQKYGTPYVNKSPEVIAHRVATNRERYGVDHYFESEEFKKRNAQRLAKRPKKVLTGATCPYCNETFASNTINSRHKAICLGWQEVLKDTTPRPCLCGHEAYSRTEMKRHQAECAIWETRHRGTVQMARLSETLQSRYGEGVTHPRLIQEAEDRRKVTILARYGAENVFCRESSIFEKVIASQEGKRVILRGAANPFSWPEVREKIKQTHLERLGVENPNQSPIVRARTRATILERYGVPEFGAAPELIARRIATNIERYGGPAPSYSAEIVEKARQTNLERWGVDWTSQNSEVRQRQLDTVIANYGTHFVASVEGRRVIKKILLDRYGVEYAPQIEGHWDKCKKTFLERYGVEHPRQDPKYWATILDKIRIPGPNFLERRFASKNPELIFTGNGSFWCWLPKIGHHKNPDFILPGPDLEHPKRDVTKVIEVFGDFWHSERFTGCSNFEHEQELIGAFADIGIACLVIWESNFTSNPDAVRDRVAAFVT